jgi:putative flippase GtrA
VSGPARRSWQLALREISAFGVVGIVCFLVDIGLFQALYAHVGTGAVTAKVLSTLISMTLAYFAHRYWSFSHRARTSVRREYLLFTLINGGALILGAAVVAVVRYPLGQEGALVLQTANVTSIVLSTALRYLAYRAWVFPAHRPETDVEAVTADTRSTPCAAAAGTPATASRPAA